MSKTTYFLYIFTLVVLFTSRAMADSGRALKLLEKQEYDKLIEYLNKDIEKDSINPGAKYVYSLLYLDSAFSRFNIDSSFYYILHARDELPRLDEKETKKLNNDGINDSVIHLQKRKVERTAFIRSKMEHTLQSYNYFIDRFPDASQLDSAIYYRNEIAYQKAVAANTYEAFRHFIYTYPEAVQMEEAKEKYENLLFTTMTSDGELETYVRFLKNNPDTPHRAEAEKNILEIATADNNIESYEWFINQYPHSVHVHLAEDFLYHRYKVDHTGQEALNRYAFLRTMDSLRYVAALDTTAIFAVYENKKYAFFSGDGERIIDFLYDSIAPALLCGGLSQDYLEVNQDQESLIVSKNGSLIYQGEYDEVEDLGSGLLKVRKNGKYGLVHKTGLTLLRFNFDDIQLLHNTYVKVLKNGKWGLKSLMGREILRVEYDEIEAENDFIAIKKAGYYAITNVSSLKPAAEGRDVPLFFSYDDYFLIDDIHLVAISQDKEALLDENLKVVAKLKDHEILYYFDGWIEKSNKGYRIYDRIYYPLSSEYYEKVLIDPKKIAYSMKGIWGIYFEGEKFNLDLDYDSVHFLSKSITLLFKDQNLHVSFGSDSLITFQDYQDVRLIRPQSGITDPAQMPTYLMVKNKKGMMEAFNEAGVEIVKGRFDDVEAVGREYLVVTRNGKKGLFLYTGKELLNAKYQGLSNYDNGYITTMLNNKFGLYTYRGDLLLSAKHDKPLKTYGPDYFISTSSDGQAFVDKDNDFITDFEFDRINFWNDTCALVKASDEWQLFDVKNKVPVYEGIEVYQPMLKYDRETIIRITKEGQVGLLSNVRGEMIGPTFNDIYNIGTHDHPIFFAEKFIPEANFYIVIYYDPSGNIIRKQVFNEEEYWKVYCEDPND